LALPSFPKKYGLIRVFTDIYIIAPQNHQILKTRLAPNLHFYPCTEPTSLGGDFVLGLRRSWELKNFNNVF
jgi:hypothetical protein